MITQDKMQENQNNQRRKNDVVTQHVLDRLSLMHEDIGDMKVSMRDSMKEVANAINKLVALETTQGSIIQTYERMSKQLEKEVEKREKLEERIDILEKELPMTKQVQSWVTKAMWGCAVAVAMFLAKFVGLI